MPYRARTNAMTRRGARCRAVGAVALGMGLLTSAVLAVPAAPADAVAGGSAARTRSYVVFIRSPSASVASARLRARVRASQRAVTSELAAFHVRVLARTLVPDTLTVRLTGAQVGAVRADPSVTHVLADGGVSLARPISIQPHPRGTPVGPAGGRPAGPAVLTPGICGSAAHPQLNPEALTNIDAQPAINAGWDGAGVKVAYIADGVDPSIPDFQRSAQFASPGSPAGSPVIVDSQDFSGDGTVGSGGDEAFLDASSMVAQANTTYDLSQFVPPSHALPIGCDIRVQGDAPGATLEALKGFGSTATISSIIQAIDDAVLSGVKVLNESFATNPLPDTPLDAIKMADDAAVAAGVTVVVASGDAGTQSTIGSPATDPNVIAVGATTTFRGYLQTAYGGINVPGVGNGRFADDNISSISSGGFAQNGRTVDLVAPGDLNWADCSTDIADFPACAPGLTTFGPGVGLLLEGGTSEAAPLTAGAAADVIQAYAATHRGALPAPALVKQILTSSARDIGAPGEQQGAGLLDITAAVRLARSLPGTAAQADGGVLVSTSQLDLAAMPSSTVSASVAITNTSDNEDTLTPSLRALVQTGSQSGTVTMDPSVGTAQPRFSIWSGAQEIYQLAHVAVPTGTDRLDVQAAYQFTGQGGLLHVAVFSPDGTYEGYSETQGLADYADVQVADPQPGAWTLAFFTVWDGEGPGVQGTSGPVPWTATLSRYERVGSVDPSELAIPAGATRTVTVHLPTGSNPGDTGFSLVVGGGATIPVTLRTLVRVSPTSGGTFTGTRTGGDGRNAPSPFSPPAQTNTYVFTVPAGESDLDASIALAANPPAGLLPGDELDAYLVDPNGEVVAFDSNYTLDSSDNPEVRPSVQLYKASPQPGRYLLVLDWVQPLTGVATSVSFTGAIRFNLVSVLAPLPDSASTDVSKTSGATFDVTVRNSGVAPMLVSTDARLDVSQTISLPDFIGQPATQPIRGALNVFFVPTETSSISLTVTASVPVTFDYSFAPGDPDVSPQTGGPGVTATGPGTTSSIAYTPGTSVTPGPWNDAPAQLGPFGTGPAPDQPETTTATATTLGFDPTVSSPTGDLVEAFTTGGAAAGFLPPVIDPGGSITIPVTIQPTASQIGDTLSGTLFIDGIAGATFAGTLAAAPVFPSEIAAIPYRYTVTP